MSRWPVWAAAIRPRGPLTVTVTLRSAGTRAPRKRARRPYLAGLGAASVMPYAVTTVVWVDVSPALERAVSAAVQRPAP